MPDGVDNPRQTTSDPGAVPLDAGEHDHPGQAAPAPSGATAGRSPASSSSRSETGVGPIPRAAGETEPSPAVAPHNGKPGQRAAASSAATARGDGARTGADGQRGNAVARIALRTLLGLVILGLAGGFYYRLSQSAPDAADNPESDNLRKVPVVEATRVPTARRWQAFGTTRAVQQTTVAAEVAGRIVEKPERIEEGVAVEAGDLLIRIDGVEYVQTVEAVRRRIAALESQLNGLTVEEESLESRLELAEEAAELARKDFERATRATEGGAGTAVDIDRARTTLTNALRDAQRTREALALVPSRRANIEAQILAERANERIAELNVERTEIRAPFSGRVQEVLVEQDERVAPGSSVARIVDPQLIEVPLRVAVSAAAYVAEGDGVTIRSTGEDDREWTGRVARVAPEADPEDRTITVFALVEQDIAPGAPIPLKPGQFVTATVETAGAVPRIVLPRRAVRDNDTVLVIDGSDGVGMAAVRHVDPGPRIDADDGRFDDLLAGESQWMVVEPPARDRGAPLRPGELVIVAAADSVLAGSFVQAASPEELLRSMAPEPGGEPGGKAEAADAETDGDQR